MLAALAATPALAMLPPAPDAAKEQAKEAAAKAAWSDKVGAYKLCLAQDRVVAEYRKSHQGAAPPSSQSPPCSDPGPYASSITPNANKPLEASEAHSPPGTAHSPPSTNATAAELQGSSKK
jgi:hypothetical protein